MDGSRYQLVDSLYGPGTVGAWLLSLCAVLISWTLNTSSRRKDTISVDFITTLLLPFIAAGHAIFQITRLPAPVAEVITAQQVELQRYASAQEAPLNICETFSVAALLLAVFCGPWWGSDPKWTRLGLVLIVGLLSWGTENIMFGLGTLKGVRAPEMTLTRPYLFFFTPIVASTWAFLALCLAVGAIVWIVSIGNNQATRRGLERRHLQRAPSRVFDESRPYKPSRITQETRDYALHELQALEPMSRSIQMVTFVSILFLPFSLIASTFGFMSVDMKSLSSTSQNQFILIPNSNGSLSHLDQLLALVGGVIIILAAIRRAHRSDVKWDMFQNFLSRDDVPYDKRKFQVDKQQPWLSTTLP